MRKLVLPVKLFGLLLCFIIGSPVFAQDKTVSGTVLADDDGSPLEGVTITNMRNDKKVTTNSVGFYSIAAQKGDKIAFTYVGYERKELTFDGTAISLSTRLAQGKGKLDDVVVTAYGVRREKKQLPYAVQEIAGEELAQTRRDNFLNSLAGRVPGATVTSTSGLPGASATVILRGATSIGGNNQPLFVVDGVPYDNQTLNQENLIAASNASGVGFANRNSDYNNRAMDINAEDIESVTILKGPEATALYGSQGAAGVILVTTKKGKAGIGTITYDNNFGWSKLYRFPEVQTVYGRGTNGVKDNAVGSFFGEKYPEGTKFYDNFNAFFRSGFQQQHSLSFEGGANGTTFRFSGSTLKNEGVIPTSSFERSTFRLSINSRLSPKLALVGTANYVNTTTDKISKGAGSPLLSLLMYPRDYDITDYVLANGNRKTYRGGSFTSETDNPFWDVNKNGGTDKTNRLSGNITLNYTPFKWLTLTGVGGYDGYSTNGSFITHPQSFYGAITSGFISGYTQLTNNANYQLRATLKKKWGEVNNTLLIGSNIDDYKTNIDSYKGEQFFEVDFKSINNTKPETRDAKTTFIHSRNVRFYSNYIMNYRFVNFSLGFTREGDSKLTSKFYPDKDPFFNYGSVGANIVPTDIPEVKKALPWLSFAKLRYNYATTGKSVYTAYAIDYAFVSQISTGGGYALGVTGGNQNLKPEITRQADMGFELKFFKNRLGLDFTYYSLKSRDQILAARTSYLTGYVLKFINGGLVQNRGLEIQLTGTPIQTKKFSWDVTVNFDRNVGEILEMPKGLPFYYDSDTWMYGNARSQAYQGAFTGNLAGYTFLKNANGELLIDPATGYPITDATFQNIADRQPKFKIGIINSFTYKSFALNFNLDIRKGGDVFNANEMYLYTIGLSKKTLDREQPRVIQGILRDGLENTANPTRNTVAITPYFTQAYYTTTTQVSEADFVESVDWLRLRDITLSYKLPSSVIKKLRVIKGMTISVSGQDLFLITNYSGADPNVNGLNASSRGLGGAGIDYGAISNPRRYNVGLRMQL
jgi:ferric enterobactin receptor